MDLRDRSCIKVWKKCIKRGDLGSSESVALGSALCIGAEQLALQVWLCRALVLPPAPPAWNFCWLQTALCQGGFFLLSLKGTCTQILGLWRSPELAEGWTTWVFHTLPLSPVLHSGQMNKVIVQPCQTGNSRGNVEDLGMPRCCQLAEDRQECDKTVDES